MCLECHSHLRTSKDPNELFPAMMGVSNNLHVSSSSTHLLCCFLRLTLSSNWSVNVIPRHTWIPLAIIRTISSHFCQHTLTSGWILCSVIKHQLYLLHNREHIYLTYMESNVLPSIKVLHWFLTAAHPTESAWELLEGWMRNISII